MIQGPNKQGKFRVDKTVQGHRLLSPYIFPHRTAARQAELEAVMTWLREGVDIFKAPTPATSSSLEEETVRELLARRLDWLQAHRSPHHYADNASYFKRLAEGWPDLMGLGLSLVTEDLAEDVADGFYANQMERGKSGDQANKLLVALRTAWNEPWARRRGPRLRPNPWALDDYSVERRAKYIPTEAEMTAVLLAAAPVEFKIYIELLRGTGARPGEGRSLRWQDVEAGRVVLWTAKKSGGNRTPRRVPVSQPLAERLAWWRRQGAQEGAVFVFQRADQEAHRGQTWARKGQVRACQQAGVPFFSLHSYRHFYASRLAQDRRIPLVTIQALLGHEDIQTTNGYLHQLGVWDENIAQAV